MQRRHSSPYVGRETKFDTREHNAPTTIGRYFPLTATNTLLATFVLLILSACILVDDFSPAWEKSAPDYCISKIAAPLYLNEFRRDPENKDMSQLARILTLGNQHFLMLKKDSADNGGRLYRFQVTSGIFQRYRLNPAMRKNFERDYPNAPASLKNDTVRITALDDTTLTLLAEIAARPQYWEIEDQELYNAMLNPACRFEDRDLNTINGKIKNNKAKAKK